MYVYDENIYRYTPFSFFKIVILIGESKNSFFSVNPFQEQLFSVNNRIALSLYQALFLDQGV